MEREDDHILNGFEELLKNEVHHHHHQSGINNIDNISPTSKSGSKSTTKYREPWLSGTLMIQLPYLVRPMMNSKFNHRINMGPTLILVTHLARVSVVNLRSKYYPQHLFSIKDVAMDSEEEQRSFHMKRVKLSYGFEKLPYLVLTRHHKSSDKGNIKLKGR